MKLEDYPDVLTVKEAAEILRTSERMIYLFVNEGALPAFRLKTASGKPMKRWFIPKRSIIDYVESAA